LKKQGRKLIRNLITLIIGIILIIASFAFWQYTVSPICSVDTYHFNRPLNTTDCLPSGSFIEYFGYIIVGQFTYFNRSRPIDYSINTNLTVEAAQGGPIEITVYAGNQIIFQTRTNETVRKIRCSSKIYNASNPQPGVFPNITSPVPASWSDAFTGGITSYMLVKNLNSTVSTKVSYKFSYKGMYRSSNGITLLMLAIGVILIIIEGVVFLRILIRRVRKR
jgi:uncharacterized membrane protein